MDLIAILVCLAAIAASSFTNGNMQANNLMVKVGGTMNNWYFWGRYSQILDIVLFWIIPLALAIAVFGLWGLLYLICIFLFVAKASPMFLVRQLRKRLSYAEASYREELKKWERDKDNLDIFDMSKVNLEIEEHKVNELKWLISHPKGAQHLALSSDKKPPHPEILAAFEVQVKTLDGITRKQRGKHE